MELAQSTSSSNRSMQLVCILLGGVLYRGSSSRPGLGFLGRTWFDLPPPDAKTFLFTSLASDTAIAQ
jgi:hypothetical protein